MTYTVVFFIQISTREIHVAGVTPHPHKHWMMHMARNVTMADWGVLGPGQCLIHDGDTKFCSAVQASIEVAGVKPVVLPARSPHLNVDAERWVRSVTEECLARLMLLGEGALRHALKEYVDHYHHERPHQGQGNVLLLPGLSQRSQGEGPIRCLERLGGLLKYCDREAA